jgi:uncharacterized coiled-coil DUF342 family protein
MDRHNTAKNGADLDAITAQVSALRRQRDHADRQLAAADARLGSLRDQYNAKLAELKKLGINDPKDIPDVLARSRETLQNLLDRINDGIPDEFAK